MLEYRKLYFGSPQNWVWDKGQVQVVNLGSIPRAVGRGIVRKWLMFHNKGGHYCQEWLWGVWGLHTSELYHLIGKGARIFIHQLVSVTGGELFLVCVKSQNFWPFFFFFTLGKEMQILAVRNGLACVEIVKSKITWVQQQPLLQWN